LIGDLIEIAASALGEWLLNGPDKGWAGRLRMYSILVLVAGLCRFILWLYFSHIHDLGTTAAIALGFGLLLAGIIGWGLYRAIGDARRLSDDE